MLLDLDEKLVGTINSEHRNPLYLKDISLPENIRATTKADATTNPAPTASKNASKNASTTGAVYLSKRDKRTRDKRPESGIQNPESRIQRQDWGGMIFSCGNSFQSPITNHP
jgi:hypothetical protein